MTRKQLSVLVSAAALMISSPALANDEPIKIGFAVAESGWLAAWDTPTAKAAIMKIEEINAAGGLLGRQIVYEKRDSQSEAEAAARAGSELVDWGADLLVVAADYDLGAPAALAASGAHKIAISLGAADPKMGVHGVGPTAFTMGHAAQIEGVVMAEWAYENGTRTAYILEDDSFEFTKSACAGFKAAWKSVAGDDALVGADVFKNTDASVAAQVTRIRALDPQPDAVFICSYPPGSSAAIRQLRGGGVDATLLGIVAMGGPFWLDSVPDLSNFYAPSYQAMLGDDPRPEIIAFQEAYAARWGEKPQVDYVGNGYSAIEVWATAVERAGTTDTDAVLAELEAFDKEPFLVGPMSFDNQWHIQLDRPLLIVNVENGKMSPVGLHANEYIPSEQLLLRIGEFAN